MKQAEANFKQRIDEMRYTIKSSLESILAEEYRFTFVTGLANDGSDYYEILPLDNELIRNSKLMLNILTALAELYQTYESIMAIKDVCINFNAFDKSIFSHLGQSYAGIGAAKKLYTNYQAIDRKNFNEIWLIFQNLSSQCLPIFNLIRQGCFDALNQNTPNTTIAIKNILDGFYAGLTQSQPNAVKDLAEEDTQASFMSYVKNGLQYLQEVEQRDGAAITTDATTKNDDKSIIRERLALIQEKIIEAVDNVLTPAQRANMLLDSTGNYVVLPSDTALLINIKQVLNGLHGLTKLYHAWSNWNDVNIFSTLAQLFTQLKMLSSAYHTLTSQENLSVLAGGTNQMLRSIIFDLNGLMRDFSVYIDKIEINMGIKPGLLAERIKPVFTCYTELAVTAKVDFGQQETYPFWQTRIKALYEESKSLRKASIKAKVKANKMHAVSEILNRHANAPLSDYILDELLEVKRHLRIFKLSEQDYADYLKVLNAEIEVKMAADNNNNQAGGYLSSISNMFAYGISQYQQTFGSIANYMRFTKHAVIMDHINQQIQEEDDKKNRIDLRSKMVESHLKFLKDSQVIYYQEKLSADKKPLQESSKDILSTTNEVLHQRLLETNTKPSVFARVKLFVKNVFDSMVNYFKWQPTTDLPQFDDYKPVTATNINLQQVLKASDEPKLKVRAKSIKYSDKKLTIELTLHKNKNNSEDQPMPKGVANLIIK